MMAFTAGINFYYYRPLDGLGVDVTYSHKLVWLASYADTYKISSFITNNVSIWEKNTVSARQANIVSIWEANTVSVQDQVMFLNRSNGYGRGN